MAELVTVPMDFLVQGKFSIRTVAYKLVVASVGTLVSFLIIDLLKKVVQSEIKAVLSVLSHFNLVEGATVDPDSATYAAISLVAGITLSSIIILALRLVVET